MSRSGYYQPAYFYNEVIPEILRDKTRLFTLLITNEGVDRYPPGTVLTGRQGLEIEIRSGSLGYPAEIADRLRQAQDDALIVVFADENDLGEASSLMKRLRLELPDASLVLMVDEASTFIAPARLRNMLNDILDLRLVVTGFVGGRIPMRKVLDHVLFSWTR